MRRTFHAGVCIGHRPLTVCYASASAPICRSHRYGAIKGIHQYRVRNTECLRGRHWRVTRCQPLRSDMAGANWNFTLTKGTTPQMGRLFWLRCRSLTFFQPDRAARH